MFFYPFYSIPLFFGLTIRHFSPIIMIKLLHRKRQLMTIKEIAALAGVSISTVSKIVNNKDQNIAAETRNKVLEIVKKYNYTPYGTVKNLSSARSFILGVVLSNMPHTNSMLSGITEAAAESDYNILLFDSQNRPDLELKHINALSQKHVDGVIWEPISAESHNLEHYLTSQDIPFICIMEKDNPHSYKINFEKMGYLLTQKLIDYKHAKIACLMKPDSQRSLMVLEGFRKCLFDNHVPYHNSMEISIKNPDYLTDLLGHKFSGVVTSHFSSALMLYEDMSRLHYSIPSDLSVVSLKDEVREAIFYPHISSLAIPYKEFGYHIGKAIVQKCEKMPDTEGTLSFSANYSLDTEDSLYVPSFLRSKKIVVVGSINTDLTFNVDSLPQTGKATRILNSTFSLGGKGANQAVGAAKLGREVSLIGEIGNDIDSNLIFDQLEKEHVITQGIQRNSNSPTGKAYIYIEESGESAISILAGANNNLTPKRIQKCQHLFKNAGCCLISTELTNETTLEAAKVARRYGAKTFLKPTVIKTMPNELCSYIDFFIPNRYEASLLSPPQYSNVEDQAAYFLDQGIPNVIITLGSHGCYLKTKDTARYFPAASFTPIDTTGGADAFISCLASCITSGYSLEKSIQIANYAAGFCISRQGVVPALVDRTTLLSHIKRIEPELLL